MTKPESLELLCCDKRWPVCLFDFSYKNKIPEFFIFRVSQKTVRVFDNYFYGEKRGPDNSP